jgi:hypothetical protein
MGDEFACIEIERHSSSCLRRDGGCQSTRGSPVRLRWLRSGSSCGAALFIVLQLRLRWSRILRRGLLRRRLWVWVLRRRRRRLCAGLWLCSVRSGCAPLWLRSPLGARILGLLSREPDDFASHRHPTLALVKHDPFRRPVFRDHALGSCLFEFDKRTEEVLRV